MRRGDRVQHSSHHIPHPDTCDVFAETFTGRVRAWPRFTSSKYPRADVGTNLPSWPGRIKTICWSETRLRPDTASELGPGGVARSGHP